MSARSTAAIRGTIRPRSRTSRRAPALTVRFVLSRAEGGMSPDDALRLALALADAGHSVGYVAAPRVASAAA